MTDETYQELTQIVGVVNLRCKVFGFETVKRVADGLVWTKVSKCIYIVVDGNSDVAYVGSVATRQNGDGVCARMREHIRKPERAHWEYLYILPLRESTSDENIRRLEGLVGRRLRRYDEGRLPK